MEHHVEPFAGRWGDKVHGEQVEISVADIELMRTACIPLMKPSFANLVRYIEEVELVGASSPLKQGAHSCSARWRVCREIQDYR